MYIFFFDVPKIHLINADIKEKIIVAMINKGNYEHLFGFTITREEMLKQQQTKTKT